MAAFAENERVKRPEKGEGHYKSNLRDVQFNLFEVFGRDKVYGTGIYEAVDVDTALTLLQENDALAKRMAKSFTADDRNPSVFNPKDNTVTVPEGFRRAYEDYIESGFYMAGLPEELGGMNAPRSLTWAMSAEIVGANPPVLFNAFGPTMAAIHLNIEKKSGREDGFGAKVAKNIVNKQWAATMVLTEPDAGSDVGAAITTAKPVLDKDGSPTGAVHIEGVKRFITAGEHDVAENIVHYVLARPPEGKGLGTKGLTLYMVPKYLLDPETGDFLIKDGQKVRNGVYATNLEHKMGIKASPTCELTFGEKHPAVGYVVGEELQGIANMFNVIEDARGLIGKKSAETLSTAYLNALEYAQTRVQGPDMTQMADKSAPKVEIGKHSEVRRSLVLQKAYAEGLRALSFYTATYQDDMQIARAEGRKDQKAEGINDLLLPVVKGFGSERANELISKRSLQVFGGSGFLKDYPMEQYVRDSKIDTIYEGTTDIQAKDFFFRKIVGNTMKGGDAFSSLMGEVKGFATDESGELAQERQLLHDGAGDVQAITDLMVKELSGSLEEGKEKDIYKVGQNTERLLMAFGDLMVGWLLLRQAEVAQKKLDAGAEGEDKAFYEGKVVTAKFFAREVLPRLAADRKSAGMVNNEIMEMPDGAF